MKLFPLIAPVIAALAGTASAATIISVTSVTGHHQGDSYGSGGSMLTIINGQDNTNRNGVNLQSQPDNPSVWTHGNRWQDDWQGNLLSGTDKKGWAVFDFGSEQTQFGMMYLWNVNETANNHLQAGTNEFNIHYATNPTTTPPARSSTATDYDFSSGGWTKLNSTTLTLAQGDGSTANALDGSYDISAISSARYIGLELISNYGATDRVGLGEVVFTVPETSSSAMLLGLIGLGLLQRRRRHR
jgi:hypothetical protein